MWSESEVKNRMFSTSTRMEVSPNYNSTLDTTMREVQEAINLSRRSSGGGWRRVAKGKIFGSQASVKIDS